MSSFEAAQDRDANRQVLSTPLPFLAKKTRAYTGASGLGAIGAATLFTVTGDVIIQLFGICTESLAGATATIEAGVSGNTPGIIEQTTATNITANKIWRDNSPGTGVEDVPTGLFKAVAQGLDIIETIATANVTDGTIIFYCFWRPLSTDGNVVAA